MKFENMRVLWKGKNEKQSKDDEKTKYVAKLKNSKGLEISISSSDPIDLLIDEIVDFLPKNNQKRLVNDDVSLKSVAEEEDDTEEELNNDNEGKNDGL